MNYLKYVFVFFIFYSCTKEITTLDEYSKIPVKFAKERITSPSKDFSIIIPKNWKWKEEKHEDKQVISGIDIGNYDSISKFTKIISIYKCKSLEENKDLETEFQTVLKNSKKNKLIPEVVESGKTKILKYESYFIHAKSDNEKSIEMISFIIKSKESGIFYLISASCHNQDNLKTNMGMMIDCIQTFKFL